MKRMLLTACLIFSTPAFAINPNEMFADPAQEARARDIGRELRCLVCRNQSIFDSNAGLAHDLRAVVRERMIAGDTDDEILAYVQDRFGDYVLLKPPIDTHTYVLWSTPIVFLVFGLFGAALYMRGRPRELPSSDEEALS